MESSGPSLELRTSVRMAVPIALPRLRSLPAPGGALRQHQRRADPGGAEVPEVLAQLAPGGEYPHRIEEGERERPDGSLRRRPRRIAIVDRELALGAGPRGELLEAEVQNVELADSAESARQPTQRPAGL